MTVLGFHRASLVTTRELAMANFAKGDRALQALGIFLMCLICVVIVDKAINDVSALLQHYPDDFWRALAKYALNNLAGGQWGNWRN